MSRPNNNPMALDAIRGMLENKSDNKGLPSQQGKNKSSAYQMTDNKGTNLPNIFSQPHPQQHQQYYPYPPGQFNMMPTNSFPTYDTSAMYQQTSSNSQQTSKVPSTMTTSSTIPSSGTKSKKQGAKSSNIDQVVDLLSKIIPLVVAMDSRIKEISTRVNGTEARLSAGITEINDGISNIKDKLDNLLLTGNKATNDDDESDSDDDDNVTDKLQALNSMISSTGPISDNSSEPVTNTGN